MRTTASKIQSILSYAEQGWKIIPLHNITDLGRCSCGSSSCDNSAAKHPRLKGWQEQATLDSSQIRNWWNVWPHANVGVVTGKASGIIVLDVDPRHGGDNSLDSLTQTFGDLPRTARVITGGGGQHIYFCNPNVSVGNKVNIRPGLDLRAEGGYIVVPPSLHKSNRLYEWEDQIQDKLAEPPEWFLELLQKQKAPSYREPTEKVFEGSRHSFLTSKAGSLKKVGISGHPLYLALQGLNQEKCSPPLEEQEVHSISKSISLYPSASSSEKLNWSNPPKELPPATIPVPELPENLIPLQLRGWVMDIADRMQVAPEFVMAPAIVVLSSVVGRKITIFPKEYDDWNVVPNLWGAVIARPGYFKSPTMAEALKPLDKLIELADKDFEDLSKSSSSESQLINARLESVRENLKRSVKSDKDEDLSLFQSEIEELEADLETIKVTKKRYKTNDATVEKIAHLLKENPNGLLVVRDELSGWMRTLEKAGREGDREFYLEAWNGFGTYTVDRVGTGTIHVPTLCLSIIGGIQPGKLMPYVKDAVKGTKGDDGLLQRFQILVYPDSTPDWENVDRLPDIEAKERVIRLFSKLDQFTPNLLSLKVDEKSGLPGVRFSPKAQLLFNAWRMELEKKLRSDELDCPAFESHLAKYRKLMPSLALLFWILEAVETESGNCVSVEATEMAIGWCSFLEKHARKVYSPGLNFDLLGANILARKIRRGELNDKDTIRSVYRKQWTHLENTDKVEEALLILEKYNWVQMEETPVKGGYSRRIRIHPNLLSQN
jgi:putative DNA primase/helicase